MLLKRPINLKKYKEELSKMNNTGSNIFYKVIAQFFDNRFAKDVEEDVQKWFLDDVHEKDKEDATLELWQSMNVDVDMSVFASLECVKNKLGFKKPVENKITIGGYLLRISAVLLPILAVIGGYLLFEKHVGEFSKSEMARIIEFTAPYGERKELILPDSTHVWVNSGSTVRYPAEFNGDERRVHLSGEAYFAVSKNIAKPFRVEAIDLTVEALSSGLNICAYPDKENTTVILTQGNAQIETPDKKFYKIRSWQKLTVNNKLDSISIGKIDDNDLAWKTGQLVFRDARLADIVQSIENIYLNSLATDRPINYNNNLYTVKFSKKDKLSDVLVVLNDMAPGFNFREE